MRTFIVLCLAATSVYAQSSGYNYQQNTGSPIGSGGLGGGLGSGGLGGGLGGLGGGLGGLGGGLGGSGGGLGGLGGGLGGGNFGSADLGAPIGGLSGGPIGNDGGSSYSAPAELNKEFFTFSAPEHEFNDNAGAQQIANSLKQNLRVVFIKGPENKGLEDAALALAKHASDDKTAIYVLNKQTDLGDLANKLNAIRNNNSNKPDVHFVKYRTPEDAANAQRAIQGQYDSLGGQSQAHDGGVAPVINFASQAPVRPANVHAPGNAYLPSSVFRRV